MANIPRTVIGTSDPVDICKGFNLFAGGNARALQLGFHRSQILLSTNPQILAWRFNVEAGYNFFAGVCGPAYALRFEAQGQTTGDQIRLNITNDETAAGFVFGVQVEIFCNFSVEQFALRWIADGWNSRFAEEWNTVFSARPSVTLDLIEILRDIILKFFGNKGQSNTKLEKSNTTKLKENVSSWGMLDFRRGQFATNNGTLEVNPSYAIPINLIPLTKAFPPPFNALYLADELLQKLWGGLELGPRFTVGIPVKVQLTTIVVMDAIYRNLKFDGSQVTGSGGREIPNPSFMSVSLSETPGFEITFDFFVNVSVCKLFSLEASVPIANLTALLGIKVALGPFSHSVSSTIGGGPRAFGVEQDDLAAADAIDVIFEPLDEAV
jgi:hypothetical protein